MSSDDELYTQYAAAFFRLASVIGTDLDRLPDGVKSAFRHYENDYMQLMNVSLLYTHLVNKDGPEYAKSTLYEAASNEELGEFYLLLKKGIETEDLTNFMKVLYKSKLFQAHAKKFEEIRAEYFPEHPSIITTIPVKAAEPSAPQKMSVKTTKPGEPSQSWLDQIASKEKQEKYRDN